MEYDNPVFYINHKKPFTWTTIKWTRADTPYQSCLVSFELAEALGWFGVYSNDLVMGPLRLRVVLIMNSESTLLCERASGEFEERIRGALFRVKELASSAFQYYFGPKPKYD